MILYIIIDTKEYGWSVLENPKLLVNNLLVFINTFLLLSYDNKVIIVNNKRKEEFNYNEPIIEENGCIKSRLIDLINKNVCHNNDKDRIINNNESNEINHINTIRNDNNSIFVNDIGFTFTVARNLHSCLIIIISVNKEHPNDYIKYIKLSFISKRYKNKYKIHIFSQFNNPTLAEIGYFHNNFELKTFLKIFETEEIKKKVFCHTYCYCHKKEILLGLVCPVCLAVYCSFVPVCKKCRIKFNIKKNIL